MRQTASSEAVCWPAVSGVSLRLQSVVAIPSADDDPQLATSTALMGSEESQKAPRGEVAARGAGAPLWEDSVASECIL